MSDVLRLIYASENGDRWLLVSDANGVLHVRHVPTESSGGQPTDSAIEPFLKRDRHSPQNRALRRMLGELPPDDTVPPSITES
jgi:hypothetical protein